MPGPARARYRELCAEQEQLRLVHNEWGRRFREGEIDENKWQTYLKADFDPKSAANSKELGDIMNALLSEFNFTLQQFDTAQVEYPAQIDTDEKKMHYLLVLVHKLMNADIDYPLLGDASSKLSALMEEFKHGD